MTAILSLGWPRSVYKGNVKYCFLSGNDGQMTLKVKVNNLISVSGERIPRCIFGANLVIPAEICEELSCGQGKVYRQTDGWADGGNNNTPLAW